MVYKLNNKKIDLSNVCAKIKSFEEISKKTKWTHSYFSHTRGLGALSTWKTMILEHKASCCSGLKSVYMTKMVSRQKAQWHFSPKPFCFNPTYYFKTINNKNLFVYVFQFMGQMAVALEILPEFFNL